ncbi:hypothetical protein [Nocardia neocaledoniensis]|uniref:hypothetical protein n=1 Tax=Nocardia neocaledoniensis TaxID=236511 RepID=UPI00245772C3|nr:hypothetical protein [Nocardia neocaledoniensis]
MIDLPMIATYKGSDIVEGSRSAVVVSVILTPAGALDIAFLVVGRRGYHRDRLR